MADPRRAIEGGQDVGWVRNGDGGGAAQRDARRDATRRALPHCGAKKLATLARGGGGSYPAGSACVPDGHIAT